MAYPLFDHKRASDMVSWARLRPLADWHVNVTFDECDSADFSASAWGQLSTKVAQLVAGVLPSLRASGPRCRGTFSVAEIPVHAWAGQASQLFDGRPAALKRATQRHGARSSACTVCTVAQCCMQASCGTSLSALYTHSTGNSVTERPT